MLRKMPLTFLLITSSAFADKKCSLYQSQGSIGFEHSSLSGSIQDGSSTGSKLQIKDDLGINKSTTSLKAMMSKSTTHHKFGFKLEKFKHSGSKKLSSNILYNGSNYATASLINSKVSLKWAKATYRYRFTPEFAAGVDLDGLRLKTLINEQTHKKTLFMPSFGMEYEKSLEEGLDFIAKGSTSLYGNSSQHYAYAGFSYNPKMLGCSCLHLGYQYKNIHLKENDLRADLKYQGLYAGISMKF